LVFLAGTLNALNYGVDQLVPKTQSYAVQNLLILEEHDCQVLNDIDARALLSSIRCDLAAKQLLQKQIVIFAEQLQESQHSN
jgi:hypothetical protein